MITLLCLRIICVLPGGKHLCVIPSGLESTNITYPTCGHSRGRWERFYILFLICKCINCYINYKDGNEFCTIFVMRTLRVSFLRFAPVLYARCFVSLGRDDGRCQYSNFCNLCSVVVSCRSMC